MAGTKSQQNPKVQQQGKTKEKITLNLEELNKLIQKSAPRHNDNIIFEINFFILALTSITFQYLHIYRFSFYLYDFKLYIYSVLMFLRRVLLKLKQDKEISDPLGKDVLTYVYKILTYVLLFTGLYLTYQLTIQYSWGSIFVLFYFHIMIVLASFFMYKEQRYDNVVNEMNYLYKSTMFRGLEMIYFSLLLPLKCHDENLSYDLLTSIHIGIYSLTNTMLYVIFFQVCYRSEEMRKQSKTLGDWKSISLSDKDKQHVEEWTLSKAPYKRNSIVSFNNKYYIAVSKYNAAVPGHLQFKLIYHIFHDHRKTRIYLILMMCMSIIIQNLYLIYAYRGVVYILLLLQSFYVIFLMNRLDRRLQKVYK